MNLGGQIVLITGGGRGLGRAFACGLANAGAYVVVTARSQEQLRDTVQSIEGQGGEARAIPADVTDEVAVRRLVATVEEQVGPIDLLVNNAGVFRAFGLIADIDPQEWWREVEINLRGPFLYTHTVLPRMLERGRGRIINVASGAGLQPFETISAYNVSKTALIRLTESTALEVKSQGIRVFAIDPGTVRTPMNAYVHDSPEVARRAPLVQQWFHELYAANGDTPIEKAVDVVLQIASGRADALTGCYFGVMDDIDALAQQAEIIQQESRRKLRMQM
ncbi:MAG: SDR family oxidoreductase [Chloroflexi bacterium]|nr:SDR family oxidoreductase [Chloroflexota bacterium]